MVMDAIPPSFPPHMQARGLPRRVSRPLWAAPLFVAGLAVLALVCATRPLLNRPARVTARDLAVARQLLEQPEGQAADAEILLRRALQHPEHLGERIGEATYLLGWAEARRAAQAPPEQAARLWADALRDLTEAEQLGVPDDDQPKLTYQLGKVGFHAKDDPRRVLDRLQRSVADADSRAEAYDLLTQALLRLPEPDLQAALQANEKLRQVAVDDQLTGARLLGGELYLKLQRPEEARKVLERVNPPAPPALVFKARLLRARSYQDEDRWADAASLWQTLLTDKKESAQQQAVILYHLGVCYRQLEQPAEAVKVWEECLAKAGDGEEGPACALALAELTLRESNVDKALGLFARAVEKTATPEAWNNSLIDRAKAIEAFERAGTGLRQVGMFEAALKLTAPFERLAGAAKANVVRGQVWTQWAEAGEQLRHQADADAPTPEVIQDRHRQAGAAYALAASQITDAAAKATYLWSSTQRYLAAEERMKAAATFAQLQVAEPQSSHLSEGWYLLGEAHRRAKDIAAAEAAYRESIRHSIKYPTNFAYRARYQLAIYAWERGDVDDAEAALEQNLKLLRDDRDDEAQEKSLFAIGNLYFYRHNYPMAARQLEDALERFPDNPESVRARFNLANSYQQMADQKNFDVMHKIYKNPETVEHFAKENTRMLRRAADEFEKLMPLLDKPEAAAQLTREDVVEVPFHAADCRLFAGQYAEALQLFNKVADDYARRKRTADENLSYLKALEGTIRCHALLISPKSNHRDKARQRITEMELLLRDVDEPTRQKWEDWIKDVQKELAKADKAT
jgi:tetratricopeptide (TPR) repeat protein